MAITAPFIPAQPPRSRDWLPSWRGLFGKRVRNTVYGMPEPAFDELYKERHLFGMRMHIVSDPELIGHILLDNQANYVRPRISQSILEPVIGHGLLSAEGDLWRKQRRIVAPTFAPGAVTHMASPIAAACRRQIAAWPAETARLDILAEAARLTSTVIADTLFSSEKRLLSDVARGHISALVSAAGQARVTTMLGIQHLDPSPSMRRARQGRDYLRGALGDLVQERGPDGGADDFFGGLIRALHAQFPADEANRLAVDNAITFYAAGFETTSNAVTWTSYLLAAQPELQEEARAEARAALAGDIETLADRTPLLRAILDEAMRLYPPAVVIVREAVADDRLGDAQVRKGDLTFIYPWMVHRHRKLWDAPDSFDHTRFLGEAKAKQHRFQYIPFGAGPRVCVGARMAIVEALIILAIWLDARRFTLPKGFRPEPAGTVTLSPKGGLPIIVAPL